nr:metallophosphoesterase [Pseudopedobacter sp.]
DWLVTIPEFLSLTYADKKIAVVHGSYFDTSEFIFKSTEWEKKQANFDALNADIILAGHCGLPFAQANGDKLWMNAGVIGMPANDGTSQVWYAILNDDDGFGFEIKALAYDHLKASKLMEGKPVPQTYKETLKTGIWDNCEILPERETKLQGIEIKF